VSWTAAELARRCGGALVGDGERRVAGISTDSRSLRPGELFVAIRGENTDGHGYTAAAHAKGAAAFLVSHAEAVPAGAVAIVVDDSVLALGRIAAAERARFAGPVVAITGSNGKTTTKEMCAEILTAAGLRVRRTPGNLNNQIGLPLSILLLAPGDDALVVELGMNHPGEIDYLASLAQPDVGAITQVADAHIGPVGGLEAVARAKGELYERIRPTGTAVVNADDARVVEQAARFAGRRLRFGLETRDAEFRAEGVRADRSGTRFRLFSPAGDVDVRIGTPGRHLVSNGLCAAACAWATGRLGDRAPIAIAAGLASFHAAKQRLAPRELASGATLLDDTYNSNPASVRAALAALRDVAGPGRAVAALGDMLELGAGGPELHAEVGRAAAEARVDVLVAVGELSAHTARAARAAGVREVHEASDADAAGALLRKLVARGDTVLVKGSRGMRMERAVVQLNEAD
jgi:UDP-N-acetylmuramoyl-tripeptide--D-alanyl-D-alanine ligase